MQLSSTWKLLPITMYIKCILLVTSAVILTQSAILKNGVEIPTYAPVCRRSQKDVDDCLKKSLQILIPKICKVGIPQLNVSALDPWTEDEVHFKFDSFPFNLDMGFHNTAARGICKAQITGVRSNFKNLKHITMDVDWTMEKLSGEGRYSVEGSISYIPTSLSGPLKITVGNLNATYKIIGNIITEDGDEYLQVDSVRTLPEFTEFNMDTSDENGFLQNFFISMMNRFWRVAYYGASSYIENVANKLLTTWTNKFTLKIPYNQLVPE